MRKRRPNLFSQHNLRAFMADISMNVKFAHSIFTVSDKWWTMWINECKWCHQWLLAHSIASYSHIDSFVYYFFENLWLHIRWIVLKRRKKSISSNRIRWHLQWNLFYKDQPFFKQLLQIAFSASKTEHTNFVPQKCKQASLKKQK